MTATRENTGAFHFIIRASKGDGADVTRVQEVIQSNENQGFPDARNPGGRSRLLDGPTPVSPMHMYAVNQDSGSLRNQRKWNAEGKVSTSERSGQSRETSCDMICVCVKASPPRVLS